MLELSQTTLAALVAAAFLTGLLHGAVGLAGGVLMTAILAHAVGLKTAIPIMTCALLFSHGSRVFFFRKDIRWHTAAIVLAFGLPTIVLGAWIFTRINETVIALVFAVFLLSSLPVKRWAIANQITTTTPVLATASSVWGLLAGNVVGPGFFLAPFLQGTGMSRLDFVGTMAIITLAMNLAKLIVFTNGQLIAPEGYALGVLLGVATIPGNWLGKRILKRMTDGLHSRVIDVFTVLLVLNFLYVAMTR